MSQAIPFKLTVAGQDAAFNLGAINLNVTHVQLGSGNRLANGNETALVTPQESVAISGHFEVSVGQHRIAAVVPGSVSAYQVSEIGLWSGVPGAGGSVLVFYWSLATGYIALKSAGIDFNFESDMLFGGVVPGNITIVADTSFNALAMLAEHEADLNAHPNVATPPLGDNDQSPVNSEWVQQTIGAVLSKSVAGSADVTLTAVEAGRGILELTGVLTGNINVIVPTAPTRDWTVINSTSGAFALTVKTASGTGVPCPQGYNTPVFTDGTNVKYSYNGVETPASSDNSKSLINSAWAKVGFASSLSANGYFKFPNWMGGFVIQWGTATTNASGVASVTFPIAFPSACAAVVSNDAEALASAVAYGGVTYDSTSVTLTYAKNGAAANAATVVWVAFGY